MKPEEMDAFRQASRAADAMAAKKGLIVSWARWHGGRLDYRCSPKPKPEKAIPPSSSRGISQGQLL